MDTPDTPTVSTATPYRPPARAALPSIGSSTGLVSRPTVPPTSSRDLPAAPVASTGRIVYPNFLQADYRRILQNNVTRDPRTNYTRMIQLVTDSSHARRGWGQELGFQKRRRAARKKIKALPTEILETLRQVPNLAFLDWGCGDGSMGDELAKQTSGRVIYGDIENHLFIQFYDHVNFVAIDDQDSSPPRLPTGVTINAINCFHVLHHCQSIDPISGQPRHTVADIQRTVRKIYQTLPPGGLFLVREHSADTEKDAANICLTHINYEREELSTQGLTSDQLTEAWIKNYHLALLSQTDMIAVIVECGFSLIFASRPSTKDWDDRMYWALFRRND